MDDRSAQDMLREVIASRDLLCYDGIRLVWNFRDEETYVVLYDTPEQHTYALLSIGRWLHSNELSFDDEDYMGMYKTMKILEQDRSDFLNG